MRQKVYEEEISPKGVPKYFALFPTFVWQAHPTHNIKWLIWLEWYERKGSLKYLIK